MLRTLSHPTPGPLPSPYVVVGLPVHPIKLDDLCNWIEVAISGRSLATVMYANVYAAVLAQRHAAFRAALAAADVVFCDGYGIRLGAAALGYHLPERFTPPDWIDRLLDRCERHGWRVFFLGGEPGVAVGAAAAMRSRFPRLIIETHHGYFPLGGAEDDAVVACINRSGAQLLLVGMGMPRQELWLQQRRAVLEPPVTMTVGALFNYLANTTPRGPPWLTDHGFEWLCRLAVEPRRLWRRYLLGNPYFVWLVLRQLLTRRRRNGSLFDE